MNKRIITLSAILLVASALTLGAQHIPDSAFAEDPGVGRFYTGCLRIIEGELASDADARNEAYALAMDALNPRRKGFDAGRMNLTAVDTAGVADAPAPDFAFDFSYARAKYQSVDFAPSGITRGFGRTCRLFDLTLKPRGKASFSERVNGACLLVAVARPGVEITTIITVDGREIKADTFEDGLVNYAAWQLPRRTVATYTVENLSDKEATVILIGN